MQLSQKLVPDVRAKAGPTKLSVDSRAREEREDGRRKSRLPIERPMSTYLPTFPHTARNIGQRWLARTTQCGALHRCLSVRAIHPLREASTRWISPLPSVGIEDCLVLSSPSLFSVVLSVPRERQTHAEGKDVYSGAKTEASGQKRRAEREALRPSHLKRKHRAYLHRHRASEREKERRSSRLPVDQVPVLASISSCYNKRGAVTPCFRTRF